MGSTEPTEAQWTAQSVLVTLPHPPPENTPTPIPFFHLLERLKTTKREGWRRFGIAHGESISDHMYRMSIMTMFAPPALASRLNIPRCTKMALIHDMAESIVGDITPADTHITKVEKARREAEVIEYITKPLLGAVPGLATQDIQEIFQEYEDNVTLEAKFVHDIDKLELLLQAVEYERSHAGKLDLSEFFHALEGIKLPEVKEWAMIVMRERESFWAGQSRDA
ncbi:hydrolase-HD superfamily protein [Blastomyces dermatitidis ER-3]|uniref:5'-deoxynucleotidase n=2 Tax=Ajellomyces dermatitidis TaxID=5039 RepID=F2TH58_AJEDA|nr:hydrolase-HD superfamily protein [Blastomyces dermatitidis ER-3]EEQ91226.1 hydrolase-HD superfamily protein [Blastomyces dermatitidis ER-3]EGE82571.1 hydrolase-HD superfamily protein [Blastomyces dermatitidis ATCC 18188]EQL28359.1 hydrolase-HD superfamily protein [Blastomyces dermatitidis ATCC 26199]